MLSRTNFFISNYCLTTIRCYSKTLPKNAQFLDLKWNDAINQNEKPWKLFAIQKYNDSDFVISGLQTNSFRNEGKSMELANKNILFVQNYKLTIVDKVTTTTKNVARKSLNVGRKVKDSGELQTTIDLNVKAIKSLLPLGKKIIQEIREAVKSA